MHFGISKPFMAKRDKKTGVYTQGFRCGKAVSTDVNPQYAEASFYADDELEENVKKFKYADVIIGVSKLPFTAVEVVFGHTVENNQIIYNVSDKCNEVGYGFYTTESEDGEQVYWACILPCVKFTEPAESYTTVGDSIEFKNPSCTGKATKNSTGEWRIKEKFTKEEDAIAFIKEYLNISE